MDDISSLARIGAQAFGGETYRPEHSVEEIRQHWQAQFPPHNTLVAERDGALMGMATGIPLRTWVGGRELPLLGVAGVAVGWEFRRQGVARTLMQALVRRGIDEGYALMGLYPFRASFYQTHGFGSVEPEAAWDVPATSLPDAKGDVRELRDEDLPLVRAVHQRSVEQGSFDVVREEWRWPQFWSASAERMRIGAWEDGNLAGYLIARTGHSRLHVTELVWTSVPALLSLLGFVRTLHDQYERVELRLPVDLSLLAALREPHVGLDPGGFLATWRVQTTGMARLANVPKALQGRGYPSDASASARLVVAEPNGEETAWNWELENGSCHVSPGRAPGLPEVRLSSMTLAQWFLSTFSATQLWRAGALRVDNASALPALDRAMAGPAPFCRERY
jgi:predicted acetyltransferase